MNHLLPSRLVAAYLVTASFASTASPPCLADAADDCRAAGGQLLQGLVQSEPRFAHGSTRQGIELSHTHVAILADDGETLDAAIDNVFAAGYLPGLAQVPAPLDAIHPGDRLQLCGQTYKGGIHFVHTNCGDPPSPKDPDGWTKEMGADGVAGPNIEASETYCYLWPKAWVAPR